MKVVISRKNSLSFPNTAPSEDEIIRSLNSGFGNTVRVMPDSEVQGYIEAQAHRGFVCYSFDHAGTFQSQTTIVKAA